VVCCEICLLACCLFACNRPELKERQRAYICCGVILGLGGRMDLRKEEEALDVPSNLFDPSMFLVAMNNRKDFRCLFFLHNTCWTNANTL